MADDLCDASGHAERAWPGDPVRRHCEEEVGGELSVHGAVRVRRRVAVLGDLGLQDGPSARSCSRSLGQGGVGAGAGLPHRAGRAAAHHALLPRRHRGDARGHARVPHGVHGLLPVRVRRNHAHPARRLAARPHELQGLDDLRPTLAHLLLHHRRVLHIWGGGFLFHWGVVDYSGGYVIHLSSGVAGFTAAYWVGPRSTKDRERFPPNNVLLMLTGAGLLWMGWAGFNGGDPYSANIDSSLAVLNTNICAATSLLVWTCLDVIFFKKPSVIGAVQGMSGLVCITPGAGTYNSSILLLHPARCHSRESHSRRGVNRPHPTNRPLARLTGSRICNLSPVNPVSRGSAQRTESTIFHPPKGSKIQYNDSRVCLL
jgi:hypothetical protein